MKKVILILAFVLIGAIIGYFYYQSSAKHKDPAKAEIISISAKELYRMFENFEDSANKLYTDAKKEKAISVSGLIQRVDKQDNIYTVTLESGSENGAVICEMDTSGNAAIAQLKQGETKTIVGYCNGLLIDVQMFRCKLAE